MIYFTSDLHFGHANIIGLCNRPFNNVQEMNDVIIKRWNAVVGENDDVYILGDFTLTKSKDKVLSFISQLNGKIHFLRGNHDAWMKHFTNGELDIVGDYHEISYNDRQFILSHYPFAEWNHFYRGAYHLHGHQHNSEDYNFDNIMNGFRRFDVGVDANGFIPVSIEDIINAFERRTNEL